MTTRYSSRHWRVVPLVAAVLLLAFAGRGLAQSPEVQSLPAPQSQPAPQAQPAAPSQPAKNGQPDPAPNLEPQKLAIDQVESTLQRDGLSDEVLIQTRGSLEPLRSALREAVEMLQGRLAEVDARLKQIGDPPAAGAEPEDASLATERTRLNQRRSVLDGGLKQSRLLILRADDLVERIVDRRRALFTSQLFGRSSSALDPSFWTQAARAAPDDLRGLSFLGRSWWSYALANGGVSSIAAALLTLLALAGLGMAAARWLRGRNLRPAVSGTRFAKSSFALMSLLRIALTAPAIVTVVILVLDGFGLVPPRIMEMAFGLVVAVAMAAFGRGVAIGLFAPDDPELRLLNVKDNVARVVSSHMIWAARVLGIVVFVTVLQRTVVAQVSLTVALSALFAAIIAGLLSHFLCRIGSDDTGDDDISRAHWLRGAGWLLVAGIVVSLATGFIAFAAFLSGRFLIALGVIGALHILLVSIDALFTEVLTASSPRGRAVASFFGLKPRSIELFGTLLSAVIRVLLILVVLLPLLGPWGLFAADFVGVVR